jgi:hypothetical protein
LLDYTKTPVRTQLKTQSSEKDARAAAIKNINKVNDDKIWHPAGEKTPAIEELIHDESDETRIRFIDLQKFLLTPDHSVGKPGVFGYEILDKDQFRFKFKTLTEFENKEKADTHARRLLFQMTDIDNYKVGKAKDGGGWGIYITKGEEELAFAPFASEKEAEEKRTEIHSIVDQYTYHAHIDEKGDTWKFEYNVGYEPGQQYKLESQKIYANEGEAVKALTTFSDKISQVVVEKQKDEMLVKAGKKDAVAARLFNPVIAGKK